MNGLERARRDYEGDTPEDLDACDDCAGSGYRNGKPCRNCDDGVIVYDRPDMHPEFGATWLYDCDEADLWLAQVERCYPAVRLAEVTR